MNERGIEFVVEPTNSLERRQLRVRLARATGTGVVLELICCRYDRGPEALMRDHVDMLALVPHAARGHTGGVPWAPTDSDSHFRNLRHVS